MISDYEFEDVQNKLTKLRQEFDELSIKYQEHAPNRSLNPAFPHGQPMFAFREIHGPIRQDIDSTHTVTFYVDYDTFISKLYNAKLKVRFNNVRANVTGSAGGGGTTVASQGGGGTTVASLAGSNHTHTVSGGTAASGGTPTSNAGSTHTHTMSGSVIGWDGNANYYSLNAYVLNGSTATSGPSVASTQDNSAPGDPHNHSLNSHTHNYFDVAGTIRVAAQGHTHTVSGGITALGEGSHTHTVDNHTHTLTGISAVNEGSHTHNVTLTNHQHDVVLNNHSHGLTYGIFEQAFSNPGLSISINGVDRTAALGGPWNASPGTLDITQYLRETSDDPVRGEIPIVFSVASSLLNIEATLKSMVFSSDLLAAGGV